MMNIIIPTRLSHSRIAIDKATLEGYCYTDYYIKVMKDQRIILGRRGFSTPHRREESSRQRYAEMGIRLVRNINNAF